MRLGFLLGGVAVAAWASAGAGGAGQPPACTADEQMKPFIAEANSLLDEGRPTATHPNRVELYFAKPKKGYPVVDPATVRVSAPAGVELDRTGLRDLHVDVTAPRAMLRVPLHLTWVQEDRSKCKGSGTVALKLRDAKPATVKFVRRGHIGKLDVFISRPHSGDATPTKVIVRARNHTLRPPTHGRPILKKRLAMGVRAPGTLNPSGRGLEKQRKGVWVSLASLVNAYPPEYGQRYQLNVSPKLSAVRFWHNNVAFSVVVRQSGKRLGWVKTGIHCKNGSAFSVPYTKCSWRGFKKGR
jgi:hypothetical protein